MKKVASGSRHRSAPLLEAGSALGSAYPLVQLHPNVGVPAAAVHRGRLLPGEIYHLDTSSGIPAETQNEGTLTD